MDLIRYLSKDLVFTDVPCSRRDDTIEFMVGKLCDYYKVKDAKGVLATVYHRESDKSTGLGSELAVPHARTDLVSATYVALGIAKKGIDWDSTDGRPVRFIFLVVGASRAAEEYLKVLADISKLMKRSDVKHSLLDARSPDEVMDIIGENKTRGQMRQ